MKNTAKILGLLLFVAIIGFSFAACEEEARDELDGTTWRASFTEEGQTINVVLTFSSPNFTMTMSNGAQTMSYSGTYSISGSTVTFTVTIEGETGTQTGTLSGNTLIFEGVTFTKQ